MKKLALKLIKGYKRFISFGLNTNCRYSPTCSIYGIRAIEEWGVCLGSILSLYRIFRCNPLSKGGYDPVKLNKRNYRFFI